MQESVESTGRLTMERYRVGRAHVDVDAHEVTIDGSSIALHPPAFDVLVQLVRSAPDVCRTSDILEAVWPGRFVGDQNLKQRVHQVRRALQGGGVEIDTVRGVGYRLTTQVEHIAEQQEQPSAEAQALFAQAGDLVNSLEFGKAGVVLERILESEPEWPAPRYVLPWVFMWTGRRSEARRIVEELLDHPPVDMDVAAVEAMHASFSGDAVAAIDRLEVVVRNRPSAYWERINLMGFYWLVGRDEKAGEVLIELERLRPDFYLTWWQKGFHHLAAGDIDPAVAAFAEADELAPENPWPMAALAPALQRWVGGRTEEALSIMDEVLEDRLEAMPPIGVSQALIMRGRLLAAMGDHGAAAADFRRGSVEMSGLGPHGWYFGLELALHVGSEDSAQRETMLANLTENASALCRAQAHGWLGVHAAKRGDRMAAEEHLRALVDVEYDGGWEFGFPTRPAFNRAMSVFNLLISGFVALDKGDPRSRKTFRRAVRTSPERMVVIPVASLDGRAHLAAREGLSLAELAVDGADESAQQDMWLVSHPLETSILAQAGAEFVERANERMSAAGLD